MGHIMYKIGIVTKQKWLIPPLLIIVITNWIFFDSRSNVMQLSEDGCSTVGTLLIQLARKGQSSFFSEFNTAAAL